MAAKRWPMGQKGIRGLLMVFILGIQKFKRDVNWMTRSWDITEIELWDLEYSSASYSIHAAILKFDFRGFPVTGFCRILDMSISSYSRVENHLESFCCNFAHVKFILTGLFLKGLFKPGDLSRDKIKTLKPTLNPNPNYNPNPNPKYNPNYNPNPKLTLTLNPNLQKVT